MPRSGPGAIVHELRGNPWVLQNARWTGASSEALSAALRNYRSNLAIGRRLYPDQVRGFPSGVDYGP